MYLDLKDAKIYYEVAGSGYPCIVIHGGLGLDHTYLKPFLTGLEDILQLVYYDQRGNGRSTIANLKALTHGVLAQDCEKLRETLGLEHPIIIGHSYGGYVALEYASRYPKKPAGLVLASTGPSSRFSEERDRLIRMKATAEQLDLIEKVRLGEIRKGEYSKAFRELLPLYIHQYSVEVAEKLVRNVKFNLETAEFADKNLLPRYDVSANLGWINLPTLVIAGKHDAIIPPSQSRILKEALPHAELVVMDTGHFPFAEAEKEFTNVVAEWAKQKVLRR